MIGVFRNSKSATFFEGLKNPYESYSYRRIVGCGALCLNLAEVEESVLDPFNRLIEVGKTSNGEYLYGLKDPNDPELKALYDDKNTVAYFSDQAGGTSLQSESKYTYAQFLSYRPLLYWLDPFGRWIELKNDRFQTAAEMCKPVIYLYPVSPAELKVQVSPNGGMTYSEPVYQEAWKVFARPDGELIDLLSGKKHDYLFWEGIGMNYPEQESGFVIKSSEIDGFLSEKLSILGLNNKEIGDFKAYWVKRLEELRKPYLKITFLKKEQFDELAPLVISPVKPHTVIRVMMTAKGLDQKESLPEQQLSPTTWRTGFTVVEWGGVVLR